MKKGKERADRTVEVNMATRTGALVTGLGRAVLLWEVIRAKATEV